MFTDKELENFSECLIEFSDVCPDCKCKKCPYNPNIVTEEKIG